MVDGMVGRVVRPSRDALSRNSGKLFSLQFAKNMIVKRNASTYALFRTSRYFLLYSRMNPVTKAPKKPLMTAPRKQKCK